MSAPRIGPDPASPSRRSRSSRAAAGLAALSLLLPAAAPAQPVETAGAEALGTVRFEVSCSPAVRPAFDRALALLHHMMYEESRRAFEAIAGTEPGCAMAHWGVAMTLFQPLWPARPGPETWRRGQELVRKAMALGPPTERERALVAAAEAFFHEPETAEWWTRIRRWAAAMEEAHRAHPRDTETSALYALSQLAAGQVAEDRMAHHARAAEVLLGIHEREPGHPGALHYTIHANDVDRRAGESLHLVRAYDDIAPGVPHALHMPTHIFVRLGEWPEVIEWNRKSADAALRFPAGDAISIHYLHALDYLVYARLQRGEDDEAAALVREAFGTGPYQENFISAFHLAAMPARHAVERRAWDEATALVPRTPATLAWERYPWAESLTWFARGLGAAATGDAAVAREAVARMEALRDAAEGAGEATMARYIEVDRHVLAGRLAAAEGRPEEAVRLLRSAADLEGTVQKHPVTPGALLPPWEALGDLLLELGRPAEAREAYAASLRVWPGRLNSLLGSARAARDAGDAEGARAGYAAVLAVAGESADRPGVREAREAVATR